VDEAMNTSTAVLIAGPFSVQKRTVEFKNQATCEVAIAPDEPDNPKSDLYIWAERECIARVTETDGQMMVVVADK